MLSREVGVDEDPFNEKPSLLWRLISGALKLTFVLVMLLFAGLCAVYYLSQSAPDFYVAAMKQEDEELRVLGSQLETTAFNIYNSALIPSAWQGALAEAEINGWLASELPAKFPEVLPEAVKDPRVSLADNKITIACRCKYKDLHGMLVGQFDLFCTDQPNHVAIRIVSIKLGIVPFPVPQFADYITESLLKSGYESSWTQMEGDPVLIVAVPDDHLVIEQYYRIQVTSFDIKNKKIMITGETAPIDSDDADSQADRVNRGG